MFKRILVPLDGSALAERAFPVAARLARATGGSVVLVRVANALFTPGSHLASAPSISEAIDPELRDMESYLNTLASSEMLAGIETETKALFGSAAPTILAVAYSYDVDLIVMTSQGKTGLKRWVPGSVTQKVARHSRVPVFVLHAEGPIPAGPHPDGRPLRALVALDGSVLAKAALVPAAQLVTKLSAPARGALHLMRVVKPPTLVEKQAQGDQEQIERLRENALHRAKTYLDSVAGHLREGPLAGLNLAVTWSVAVDDDVAQAIMRMAENGEDAEGAGAFGRCDLVAMATHGRSGLQHWVLGSVTERVLSASNLPILIVRPEEADFKHASSITEAVEVLPFS